MAMVAPTVELAEYYTHIDSPVYVYAFNHHKRPDPAIYQARRSTVHSPFIGLACHQLCLRAVFIYVFWFTAK